MADVVDADELLRRIQVARDWAAREEQRLNEAIEAAEDQAEQADQGERTGLAARATAFEAVRLVLDEIIKPGTHAS
ncbi:hypothetical protein [Streptomyces sp. CC224B]|uniref:hypothetical protein n=1 Tax=Streptomyces sp. CC224B TaxID=3044571 RepID=UPI0024A9F5A3|nr:hypothetical protein [Streptomyces sp. CC224B]